MSDISSLLKEAETIDLRSSGKFLLGEEGDAYKWTSEILSKYFTVSMEMPYYANLVSMHNISGHQFICASSEDEICSALGLSPGESNPLHILKLKEYSARLRKKVLIKAAESLPSTFDNWSSAHVASFLEIGHKCNSCSSVVLLKKITGKTIREKTEEDLSKLFRDCDPEEFNKATAALMPFCSDESSNYKKASKIIDDVLAEKKVKKKKKKSADIGISEKETKIGKRLRELKSMQDDDDENDVAVHNINSSKIPADVIETSKSKEKSNKKSREGNKSGERIHLESSNIQTLNKSVTFSENLSVSKVFSHDSVLDNSKLDADELSKKSILKAAKPLSTVINDSNKKIEVVKNTKLSNARDSIISIPSNVPSGGKDLPDGKLKLAETGVGSTQGAHVEIVAASHSTSTDSKVNHQGKSEIKSANLNTEVKFDQTQILACQKLQMELLLEMQKELKLERESFKTQISNMQSLIQLQNNQISELKKVAELPVPVALNKKEAGKSSFEINGDDQNKPPAIIVELLSEIKSEKSEVLKAINDLRASTEVIRKETSQIPGPQLQVGKPAYLSAVQSPAKKTAQTASAPKSPLPVVSESPKKSFDIKRESESTVSVQELDILLPTPMQQAIAYHEKEYENDAVLNIDIDGDLKKQASRESITWRKLLNYYQVGYENSSNIFLSNCDYQLLKISNIWTALGMRIYEDATAEIIPDTLNKADSWEDLHVDGPICYDNEWKKCQHLLLTCARLVIEQSIPLLFDYHASLFINAVKFGCPHRKGNSNEAIPLSEYGNNKYLMAISIVFVLELIRKMFNKYESLDKSKSGSRGGLIQLMFILSRLEDNSLPINELSREDLRRLIEETLKIRLSGWEQFDALIQRFDPQSKGFITSSSVLKEFIGIHAIFKVQFDTSSQSYFPFDKKPAFSSSTSAYAVLLILGLFSIPQPRRLRNVDAAKSKVLPIDEMIKETIANNSSRVESFRKYLSSLEDRTPKLDDPNATWLDEVQLIADLLYTVLNGKQQNILHEYRKFILNSLYCRRNLISSKKSELTASLGSSKSSWSLLNNTFCSDVGQIYELQDENSAALAFNMLAPENLWSTCLAVARSMQIYDFETISATHHHALQSFVLVLITLRDFRDVILTERTADKAVVGSGNFIKGSASLFSPTADFSVAKRTPLSPEATMSGSVGKVEMQASIPSIAATNAVLLSPSSELSKPENLTPLSPADKFLKQIGDKFSKDTWITRVLEEVSVRGELDAPSCDQKNPENLERILLNVLGIAAPCPAGNFSNFKAKYLGAIQIYIDWSVYFVRTLAGIAEAKSKKLKDCKKAVIKSGGTKLTNTEVPVIIERPDSPELIVMSPVKLQQTSTIIQGFSDLMQRQRVQQLGFYFDYLTNALNKKRKALMSILQLWTDLQPRNHCPSNMEYKRHSNKIDLPPPFHNLREVQSFVEEMQRNVVDELEGRSINSAHPVKFAQLQKRIAKYQEAYAQGLIDDVRIPGVKTTASKIIGNFSADTVKLNSPGQSSKGVATSAPSSAEFANQLKEVKLMEQNLQKANYDILRLIEEVQGFIVHVQKSM